VSTDMKGVFVTEHDGGYALVTTTHNLTFDVKQTWNDDNIHRNIANTKLPIGGDVKLQYFHVY
jgi:hypothetical protein